MVGLFIKRFKMNIKRTCVLLVIYSLFFSNLCGQELLKQIEYAYNNLDSLSYIEDIIISFTKTIEEVQKESDDATLELYGFDYEKLNINQRNHILDSIFRILNNSIHAPIGGFPTIQQQIQNFKNEIKSQNPVYVLNLILLEDLSFHIDTSKLRFNLISFDKHNSPIFFVFVIKGKNVEYHSFFPTFSRLVAWNVRKIYKRIMRENPEYLLNCYDLERGNTILYVVRGEIWIYRILQMKKYKLDDYVRQFLS